MLKKIRTGLDWIRSPYAYLNKALERGELSFWMELPAVGRSLVTGDPGLIAQTIKDKNLIGGRGTKALRPVVGNHSLIVLEGKQHENQRNFLLPFFFTGDIAQYDELIRKWVRYELTHQRVGSSFSGMEFVSKITLNIIIEVLFGALPEATHKHGLKLVKNWLASFSNPAVLFLKPLQVDLGKATPWGRFLANRRALHQFIRDFIHETPDKMQACGGVLADIKKQRRDGVITLSDDEMVSQMVTFLMFGHDTSAAAMGWFFHYAWREHELLKKLEEQIHFCAERDGKKTIDPEQLTLLRSAILESMRLAPVVVHLTRHAVAPTRIGSFDIRAGEKVMPCMYLAHRNPTYFPNPGAFVPGRFIEPQADWRYSYFPFGIGNRLCVGMPFALRQMVLIASELISSCRLELASSIPAVPVRNMVLIVPSGGPLMRRVA